MKNTFRTSLLLLLSLLLVLLPFTACTQKALTPTDTATAWTDVFLSPETEPQGTEPQETEPQEPDYLAMPITPSSGKLSVCGVSISEYRIVIPQNCDLYTTFAAQNLSEYLQYNAGITLTTVTDATPASDYELVIGKTNRPGSVLAAAQTLSEDEYILMMDGKSIIFYGNSYMVGGAAGCFLRYRAAGVWRGYDIDIVDIPTTPVPQKFTFETAKNAILLIGDGMGQQHINMTVADGLSRFSAADMPNRSEIITKSQSVINGQAAFTDSAASGTALATGYKTINGYVGVDPSNQPLLNVRELAHASGAKTAILSTDDITGATPSSFLAHLNNRNDTVALGQKINELMTDGRVNVIGSSLIDTNFMSRSTQALQSISAHGSNFFAMIEEGYIDKYAHNNNAAMVKHTVKRLDTLVAYCMEFLMFHPDTVLIVTADHETGGLQYSASSDSYYFTSGNHTNVNVPIYAMGTGTEYFGVTHDNTRVATFIAKIYTDKEFGDPSYS